MSGGEEAEAAGQTLYQRGMAEEEVAEIFDDAALIEAYDRSVAQAYHQAAHAPAAKPPKAKPASKAAKTSAKAAAKAETKPPASQTEPADGGGGWAVGDACLAPFEEDGFLYAATILAVDGRIATLQFQGYEDDGTQDTPLHRLQQLQDEGYEQEELAPPQIPKAATGQSSQAGVGPTPPQIPAALLGGARGSGRSGQPPALGPPPPPSWLGQASSGAGGSGPPDEAEALSAALLSWYLSGYHTGYYQALKDQRNA